MGTLENINALYIVRTPDTGGAINIQKKITKPVTFNVKI